MNEKELQKARKRMDKQILELDKKRRHKSLMRHRVGQGLFHIVKQPWTALALVVICGTFWGAWAARGFFTPPNVSADLVVLFHFALAVGLAVLCPLSLWGTLYLLGTPPRAKKIEADIAVALGLTSPNEYARRPFLISKRPMPEGAAITFAFWSKWQGIADWKAAQDSVLWALQSSNCGAEFAPGRKAYTILVTVVPGVVPKERETPCDPLFQ